MYLKCSFFCPILRVVVFSVGGPTLPKAHHEKLRRWVQRVELQSLQGHDEYRWMLVLFGYCWAQFRAGCIRQNGSELSWLSFTTTCGPHPHHQRRDKAWEDHIVCKSSEAIPYELSGVIRANRLARFARTGWFARIGNSSDSGESAWRAIKLGVSIANDSRESRCESPATKLMNPKGPKIAKIQSRLKISISLENFSLDSKFQSWPSEFPTKNRVLLGVEIEIFNLDWKFQSRRAILNFFNLWALREFSSP